MEPALTRFPVLAALLIPVLASLALALAPSATAQERAFTPEQRREIVAILREAMREDPSILREAVAAAEAADRRDQEAAARTAIAAAGDALFRDPADPVRGAAAARVPLVVFSDPRCGYCKRLHPVLDELQRARPEVRLIVKDLPVLGPASVQASRALLAAQRQGRYFEYHDALIRLREEPSEPVLRREAERVGLDWARLRRDMADDAIGQRLAANLRLAEALRIEGTPALVIGQTLVPGAVDLATLHRLVAEATPR